MELVSGLKEVISGDLVLFDKMEVADWEVQVQKQEFVCSQKNLDVMKNIIMKAMARAEEVVKKQNNVINFIVWAFIP